MLTVVCKRTQIGVIYIGSEEVLIVFLSVQSGLYTVEVAKTKPEKTVCVISIASARDRNA